jgi:hypothetical protein
MASTALRGEQELVVVCRINRQFDIEAGESGGLRKNDRLIDCGRELRL